MADIYVDGVLFAAAVPASCRAKDYGCNGCVHCLKVKIGKRQYRIVWR